MLALLKTKNGRYCRECKLEVRRDVLGSRSKYKRYNALRIMLYFS